MTKHSVAFAFIIGIFMVATSFAESSNSILIDVRTPQEFQEVHVEGAQNIDVLNAHFQTKLQSLDKSKNYKVYCRSGNRSARAEQIMKSQGFKNVENIGTVSEAAQKMKKKCLPIDC